MYDRQVVPYIGTWIETSVDSTTIFQPQVVPYIGTWIETSFAALSRVWRVCRTLYRYVD